MDCAEGQTIRNFARTTVLLPFDMGSFQRDRGIVVPHVVAANGAFIVVGSQYLLAEQGIALFTKQLEFKSQFIGEFFLNTFGKMGFEDLSGE